MKLQGRTVLTYRIVGLQAGGRRIRRAKFAWSVVMHARGRVDHER